MPTVKDLVDQYREGQIEYPQLVQVLAGHDYSDPTAEETQGSDWGQVQERSESEPDDDSFFWVEAAVDDDTLSVDQVEEIIVAIDQYHGQQQ